MIAQTDAAHTANVEHNKAWFDGIAEKHGSESVQGAKELAAVIATAMRDSVSFDKEKTTVLDFGCGIGLLSHELAMHVKSILGVDVSEASVEIYNRVAAETDGAKNTSAIVLDLKGAPGELGDDKFDVVICSMVYHHLASPSAYTKTLAHYLKPAGKLLVTSNMHRPNFDASKMSDSMRIAMPNMQGFTEDAIKEMFEGAGLTDVKYGKVWGGLAPMPPSMARTVKITEEERRIEVFLAEGTKPVV